MLVLDENLPASQRSLLRKWRVRFRAVGDDTSLAGTLDENLPPLLHRLPRPIFFTMDRDFRRPGWAHPAYCLAWLDVRVDQAAEFIRRFVRHPAFDTQAKGLGKVVRVHPEGVDCWHVGKRTEDQIRWPTT